MRWEKPAAASKPAAIRRRHCYYVHGNSQVIHRHIITLMRYTCAFKYHTSLCAAVLSCHAIASALQNTPQKPQPGAYQGNLKMSDSDDKAYEPYDEPYGAYNDAVRKFTALIDELKGDLETGRIARAALLALCKFTATGLRKGQYLEKAEVMRQCLYGIFELAYCEASSMYVDTREQRDQLFQDMKRRLREQIRSGSKPPPIRPPAKRPGIYTSNDVKRITKRAQISKEA